MKTINDGGPAFPFVHGKDFENSNAGEICEGMTLRDWFAGQALKGRFASVGHIDFTKLETVISVEEVAKNCYKMADAMIKARREKQ